MPSVSRLCLILICITMVVVSLACSLVTRAAESVLPGVTQPATGVPIQQGVMPTAVPQGAPQTGPQLTLTLPDDQTMVLQVTDCTGSGPGQNLVLVAANGHDLTDPNRAEVQISGVHEGNGHVANMYIGVTIGAKDTWTFMGNTLTATVTLESNNSGQFEGVGLINAAGNSPKYAYGQEYKFSAVWICGE